MPARGSARRRGASATSSIGMRASGPCSRGITSRTVPIASPVGRWRRMIWREKEFVRVEFQAVRPCFEASLQTVDLVTKTEDLV